MERNEILEANRPLVLYGGAQWADAIPEWMITAIKEERVSYSAMGKNEAGDCECLAYLVTASLMMPLSDEWYRAYMFLASRVFRKKGMKELPDFLQDTELSEYNQQGLNGLRGWIYEQSMKAFKLRKSIDAQSIPQLKLFAVERRCQ